MGGNPLRAVTELEIIMRHAGLCVLYLFGALSRRVGALQISIIIIMIIIGAPSP